MNDFISSVVDCFRSFTREVPRGKDRIRAAVEKSLESVNDNSIIDIQRFYPIFEELMSYIQILLDYHPNPFVPVDTHISNILSFLDFAKFIIDNMAFIETKLGVIALRALLHSCLLIKKDTSRSYNFLCYQPNLHIITGFPAMYSCNYEFRDRILIPLLHIEQEKVKYIIFTSDDEYLLKENALWFSSQYHDYNIFTDLPSFEESRSKNNQCLAFLSVFDTATFLMNLETKSCHKTVLIYHSSSYRNIKYKSLIDLAKGIKYLKFVLSLPDQIQCDFEQVNAKIADINTFTIRKSFIDELCNDLEDINTGYRYVVYVKSYQEIFSISDQLRLKNFEVFSPDITLQMANNDLLEYILSSQCSDSCCCGRGSIIPLFSSKHDHINLFNENKLEGITFILFIVGEIECNLYDVSIVLDGTNSSNMMHKLLNIHGNYEYSAVKEQKDASKNFQNDEFERIVQNYLKKGKFNGFDFNHVYSDKPLDDFLLFLADHYHSLYIQTDQIAIKPLVCLDSDIITIINCLEQIYNQPFENRLRKINDLGMSVRCIVLLDSLLGEEGIQNIISMKGNYKLITDKMKQIFPVNKTNIVRRHDRKCVTVDGEEMFISLRPGIDSFIFPPEFCFIGSLNEVYFIHSPIENLYEFIDCPGSFSHPFFASLVSIYTDSSVSLMSYNNKILIEDKKQKSQIQKIVANVSSLMIYMSDTILIPEVLNGFSIEIITTAESYLSRVLNTNSLFIYIFDKEAMNYCLNNMDALRSGNKSIRISYIDNKNPFVLVSDRDLKLKSRRLTINANKEICYSCNIRSLNELDTVKTTDEEIYVDEIAFVPPASLFHPSLFNHTPAINFLSLFLEKFGISSFQVNNSLSMSWKHAQAAREVLSDPNNNFEVPFKILNLSGEIPINNVISQIVELKKNWTVDKKRRVVIIPSEDEEFAKNELAEFISEEEPEIFGCVNLCDNPVKSHFAVTIYDLNNNSCESKPLCLTCFEDELNFKFEQNKGNTIYTNQPELFGLDGYCPLGQLFFSLRNDRRITDVLNRWIRCVVIFVLHSDKNAFFFCPDHEDDVWIKSKFEECSICHKRLCKTCGTMHENGTPCPKQMNEHIPESDKLKYCPSCGKLIFKFTGCNHMACTCGKHFCWICKRCYNTSGECYTHLNQVHGGYG